ncbi:hypothetical protein DERP_006611 [Dermatophagoides pteronyssinus]|uniref:Uncharacterized protein n=1 Tax=Dermatophagoides pteronyssinus TaxID=6956 RepID=A0ABQ8IR40_DERPT|nr:hypothetical protein DERP_006611 [Dermatophagoides pteronyssinus]
MLHNGHIHVTLNHNVMQYHPRINVNNISDLVHIYSTVGERVPICRRNILLNICATSFFASNSIRLRLLINCNNRFVLYNSCDNCATPISVCGSVSPVPYNIFLMSNKFFDISSCAFSAFLSPFSNANNASCKLFINSNGLFVDLPNNGMID